ncbi:hypothetical protein FNF31_00155 [Cafeteria roenbergensis]|uniref:chitin synthase n=1 Tax=Cafeteria roenbergensis TaxID=33653 RepID=A0A5A8DWE3_CAFRO|nr:hypothetical protein FNF31_00155 [Cafeteria roenbergensis]
MGARVPFTPPVRNIDAIALDAEARLAGPSAYPANQGYQAWGQQAWGGQPLFGAGQFDIGFAGGAPIPGSGVDPAHPIFQRFSDEGRSRSDSASGSGSGDDGAGDEIESIVDQLQVAESVATEIMERRGLDKRRQCLRRRLSTGALSVLEHDPEVTLVDYTPITAARPIDNRAPLRPSSMNRTIKLCIVITMYNEGGKELDLTLKAIAANMVNLERMCGISWKEVVVLAVQDGRMKMHKSMEAYVTKHRIWDRRMLLAEHNGAPVTCHVFERTVNLARSRTNRDYYPSMQVIFAAKEKNGGKLNSHLWAFSAFTRQFQPEFLLLLDVGTMPREFAIPRMVRAMQVNPQVAGVCGEIAVHKANYFSFVQAAQAFEYAIQHVLDKSYESVCGFIGVLPGAFSAYRWKALRGEPLNQYFLLEEIPFREVEPAIANMYLAEDRVLCYELVAKRRRNYTLHYVNDAVAETDIPTTLVDLIKQRRRWLNGTFFALIYVLIGFPRLLGRSDHTFVRQLVLSVQFLFNFVQMVISWFAIGSLFLSLFLIYSLAFAQVGPEAGSAIMWAFAASFVIIILAQLLLALGNQPNEVARVYYATTVGLGVIMYFSIVLSAWHLSSGELDIIVLIAAVVTFAVYGLCSALHWRLDVATASIAQYLFMLPTFVTTFAIFSFSNLQDISWGTREGGLRRSTLEEVQADPNAENKKMYVSDEEFSGSEWSTEYDSDSAAEEEAREAFADAVLPDPSQGVYYGQGPVPGGPGSVIQVTYDSQMTPGGGWQAPGPATGRSAAGDPQPTFGSWPAESSPSPGPGHSLASSSGGGMEMDGKAAVYDEQGAGGRVVKVAGAAKQAPGTLRAPGARRSTVGADNVDFFVPITPVGGSGSVDVRSTGSGKQYGEAQSKSSGRSLAHPRGGEVATASHAMTIEQDPEAEAAAQVAIEEAAAREVANRIKNENEQRVKMYEKEKEELRMKFVGFRTRVMILWIACNWTYVTAVLNWQKIEHFAFVMAYIMFFSLSYRSIGSIWYMLEKYLKLIWAASCARCCCFKMCWERHRVSRFENLEERVNRRRGITAGFDADEDDSSWISDGSLERRAEERWGNWGFEEGDEEDASAGVIPDAVPDDAMAPEAVTGVFSAEATGAQTGFQAPGDDEDDTTDLSAAVREAEMAAADALASISALDGKEAAASGVDLSKELRDGEAATQSALDRIRALRGHARGDSSDLSQELRDAEAATELALARIKVLRTGKGAGSAIDGALHDADVSTAQTLARIRAIQAGGSADTSNLEKELAAAEAATKASLARIRALSAGQVAGSSALRELQDADRATSVALQRIHHLRATNSERAADTDPEVGGGEKDGLVRAAEPAAAAGVEHPSSQEADEEDELVDFSALIADANTATGSALASVEALGRNAASSRARTAGSGKSFHTGRRPGSAEAWTERSAANERGGPATISGSGRGSFFQEARVITTTTTTTTTRRTTRAGAAATAAPAGAGHVVAASSEGEAVPPGFHDSAADDDGVETGIAGDDDSEDDDEDDSMADLSAMLREANAATSSAMDHVQSLQGNAPSQAGAQSAASAPAPAAGAAGRGSGGSRGSSNGTLDPAEAVAAATRR